MRFSKYTFIFALGGFLFTRSILGGFIGFFVGLFADNMGSDEDENLSQSEDYNQNSYRNVRDFSYFMLVLIAAVMNADGYTLKSELDLVKRLLLRTYGEEKTKDLLLQLRELIKTRQDIPTVCRNLRSNMNYHQRVELLHVLFRISQADGVVNEQELAMLQFISNNLGIMLQDYLSLRAMFFHTPTADYEILGIDTNATEDVVKKAFRKKAKEYHPDALVGLSTAEKKVAEEKFIKVQNAYDKIKREKGWS